MGWKLSDISIPSFRFSSPTTSILGAGQKFLTAGDDKRKQYEARQELLRSGALLIPAGGQIRKTVQGLGAYNQGVSTTPAGNIRYPVPQNIGNLLKTGFLGQYSIPEAREYFNSDRRPLSGQRAERVKLSGDKVASFYQELEDRNIQSLLNKVKKGEATTKDLKMIDGLQSKAQEVGADDIVSMLQQQKAKDKNLKDIRDILLSPSSPEVKQAMVDRLGGEQAVQEAGFSDMEEFLVSGADDSYKADYVTQQLQSGQGNLTKLYSNGVLTKKVAEKLERQGIIADADDLINKLKIATGDDTAINNARKKAIKEQEKTRKAQSKTIMDIIETKQKYQYKIAKEIVKHPTMPKLKKVTLKKPPSIGRGVSNFKVGRIHSSLIK